MAIARTMVLLSDNAAEIPTNRGYAVVLAIEIQEIHVGGWDWTTTYR